MCYVKTNTLTTGNSLSSPSVLSVWMFTVAPLVSLKLFKLESKEKEMKLSLIICEELR